MRIDSAGPYDIIQPSNYSSYTQNYIIFEYFFLYAPNNLKHVSFFETGEFK